MKIEFIEIFKGCYTFEYLNSPHNITLLLTHLHTMPGNNNFENYLRQQVNKNCQSNRPNTSSMPFLGTITYNGSNNSGHSNATNYSQQINFW